MKEAKKYINHHKVKLSGKWYITKVRASEAVEIAFEEGRISAGKEISGKRKSDLYIISERSNPESVAVLHRKILIKGIDWNCKQPQ